MAELSGASMTLGGYHQRGSDGFGREGRGAGFRHELSENALKSRTMLEMHVCVCACSHPCMLCLITFSHEPRVVVVSDDGDVMVIVMMGIIVISWSWSS